LRSLDQRMASASVCDLRNARAWVWVVSIEGSQWHSWSESRLKDRGPLTFPSLRDGPLPLPTGERKVAPFPSPLGGEGGAQCVSNGRVRRIRSHRSAT
jgi:hypothetical protein